MVESNEPPVDSSMETPQAATAPEPAHNADLPSESIAASAPVAETAPAPAPLVTSGPTPDYLHDDNDTGILSKDANEDDGAHAQHPETHHLHLRF